MKLTKSQLKQIIKEELAEVSGLGRGGDDNPDYELIESMIGGLEGIESAMGGTMSLQDVNPALKQQALDATAALHAVLSQIRKGIPRRVGMSPEEPGGISPQQARQQLAFEKKNNK